MNFTNAVGGEQSTAKTSRIKSTLLSEIYTRLSYASLVNKFVSGYCNPTLSKPIILK